MMVNKIDSSSHDESVRYIRIAVSCALRLLYNKMQA